MIDDRIANLAASALSKISNGRWPPATTEIQDEGTSLLLAVEADLPGEIFTDTVRRRVALELNGIIPSTAEHRLGSWIVVFTRNGKVYESMLPSGL